MDGGDEDGEDEIDGGAEETDEGPESGGASIGRR